MQKTALIYGTALATLVGAFLLVPRVRKDPVADPRPIDAAAVPVTSLVYSDGTLEAHARLDRGHLLVSSSEPVWMDVAIRASGIQTRAPLTAVLVIDRSGSMAGDKIDAARMAAERFILGLKDGDAVGVVSFGTDVTVDLPVISLDTVSRRRAIDAVRRVEEGGGTNIDGGLARADDLLRDTDMHGRVGRVVLLSDGRPTEGDRREATLVGHAQKLRSRGVTTSALGLGLDYNEDLLEHIAVDGGGRYRYLKDASQLAQIMDDELQQASAVVARGVKLALPRSLGVLSFVDAPGSVVGGSEHATIDIGDLAAGEERHVLMKLAPLALAAGGDVRIPAPEAIYRRAGQENDALLAERADGFRLLATTDVKSLDAGRVDDVRVRILQVEASLALRDSMEAYAQGDVVRAKTRLQEKKAEIESVARHTKNASLAAEALNFDKVMDAVAAAPAPSTDAAQDMIKLQKARAFELRR